MLHMITAKMVDVYGVESIGHGLCSRTLSAKSCRWSCIIEKSTLDSNLQKQALKIDDSYHSLLEVHEVQTINALSISKSKT